MRTPQPATMTPPPSAPTGRPARAAFTLVELLVVTGLIALLVVVALPMFDAMTGGRSVDAATNVLTSLMTRAREDAIGLQEPAGVLFYRDPATGRVAAALVHRAAPPATPGAVTTYLDLMPQRDVVLLPTGVGLQMLDDIGGSGFEDRYIGYNDLDTTATNTTPTAGTVLFDGMGRVINQAYGLRVRSDPDGAGPQAPQKTDLGRVLYPDPAPVPSFDALVPPGPPTSAVGVVLFDAAAFSGLHPSGDPDPQVAGTPAYAAGENREETWLDENGTIVLVNRYNGSLIRAQ